MSIRRVIFTRTYLLLSRIYLCWWWFLTLLTIINIWTFCNVLIVNNHSWLFCWTLFPILILDKCSKSLFKPNKWTDDFPAHRATFKNSCTVWPNKAGVDNWSIINCINDSCCVSLYNNDDHCSGDIRRSLKKEKF